MKSGAFIDQSEPYQPYIILILDYVMKTMEKQDMQGSFNPFNLGFGWTQNGTETNQEADQETNISSSR